VWLTDRTVQDKLKNNTVTSAYIYDAYGNPQTETVNYGGGITESVSSSYYNNANETGYLLGFLTDRTKTTNRNGASCSERYNVPIYSNGLPAAIAQYINGNQASYEYLSYNSQGNLTRSELTNYNSPKKIIASWIYDSYGRLTSETDPLGFSATYEYDAGNGSLSTVKNHKGQATSFSYDGFFRRTGYTYPEGTNGSTVYSWNAKGTNGLYCIYKCESGHPWTKTYYDALGRETASSGLNFNYSEPIVEKKYDNTGNLQYVSLPYTGSSASLWNTYSYDSFDRPVSISEASGRTTSYSYSGNSVTTTRDGIASTQTFDTQGNLTSVVDPAGTITCNLRPDGQPSSIVAPGNVTTSFGYDGYGRRTSITDPSAGLKSCTYDADGNIQTETDANNKSVTYGYDSYNRLTSKSQPEFNTNYAYDANGLLASETSTNGTGTNYTYDAYDRLQTEKETAPNGKWLQKTYAYANSYLDNVQYASQSGNIVTENYIHDAGQLTEIKLNGTASIWKLTAQNWFGQPAAVTSGYNSLYNIYRTYNYNSFGMPTGCATAPGSDRPFQDLLYSFDATKGNLTYRRDNNRNLLEEFSYDNLNRLTGYAGKSASYNLNGNINSRTDAGTFQYNTAWKPYAISGVTNPTNLIPQRGQTIASYTSFGRPASISEGDYTAMFTYNGRGERVMMDLKKQGASNLTRYYLSDCYEIDDRAVGGIKEKLYLGGDFYTAPAVYVKDGTGNWNIYYICRDYLGSITQIANSSGSLVQELSYDAWGQLRDPDSQAVYAPGTEPELFLGRGYTGHEQLPVFGLVNMNARLYDPALGRFLSPDPYVQNPTSVQNFNRYSYALNNPLRYTDPSGESFWPWFAGLSFLNPVSAMTSIGIASVVGVNAAITSSGIGYSLQKYISPVAFKTDFRFGSNQGGIGIDASIGFPQITPISYRGHGGATYFWKYTDLMGNNMSGWESRYGAETGIQSYMFGGLLPPGLYTYGGTTFNSSWSGQQTTNLITIGDAFFNIQYENDMKPEGIMNSIIPFGIPKGDGDRYRTAAVQINFGAFGIGTNMITGDAGPYRTNHWEDIDGHKTYVSYDGYDPNSYRMGTLYFNAGPFRLGRNSEGIRQVFQNQFAHTFLLGGKSLWFEVLNLKPKWYWQFGYSGGGTLY